MSKPRSMLVGKPDHAFRTVRGFTTVLHFGKQAKHIRGQPNHDPTKSGSSHLIGVWCCPTSCRVGD
jgi:hypothetical protein